MRGLEEMMDYQRLCSVRQCRVPIRRNQAAIPAHHHLSSTLFCDASQVICLKSSVPAQSLSQGINDSIQYSRLALASRSGQECYARPEIERMVELWRHRAEPVFYVINEGGSAIQ